MAEKLNVEIVTPDRQVLKQTADDIYLPGPKGEMGVLVDHAALLAMLSAGVVRCRDGQKVSKVAVWGGFVQVGENRVTMLADQAVLPEEVDHPSLERERKDVEAKLVDAGVGIEEREGLLDQRSWIESRLGLASTS